MYNTMGPVASREKITPLNIWGVNVFTLRLQKSSRFFIYKAHFLGGPDIPGDPTGRHVMAWSLVTKEMALVSLQRMPEEKRQKALPAVKQGILKRRGPFR